MIKHTLILPTVLAALAFLFASPLQSPVFLHAATETVTPTGSPAHNNLQTIDANGNHIKCEDMQEAKGGVLLGRIVPCLIRTIATSTQSFSDKMIQTFKPLFYSYLVFVVTMFGVKVLQGGRDLHQQAILLVLKITLVIGILQMIPNTIIPSVYSIMAEGQSIVTTTIGPDNSSINCEISKFGDSNTPLIWKQMDCVLGKLYGFTTGQHTNADAAGSAQPHNMFLAASILGLAGGFFFSGTLGITIFFACMGVLFAVFLMVLRTAISFVNGYLLVCVMLIIAPFFLPLVFMKITSNYFEKWWQTILKAMLMPVLVTAYAMFALLLYDKALFAPDALVNKLFDYNLIKDAQLPPKNLCGHATTGNLDFTSASGMLGGLLQKMRDPMTHDTTQPQLSGSNNACAALTQHVIDVDKAAQAANPGQPKAGALDFIKHIFGDCLKLVILAYLIHKGMETTTSVFTAIIGDQGVTAITTAASPQEIALQRKLQNAQKGVMEGMVERDPNTGAITKRYSGPDFFTHLGPAMGNGIKRGFIDR